jgi:hypothetical protein
MDIKTKSAQGVSRKALTLAVEIQMLDEDDRKKIESIIESMTNLVVTDDHIKQVK